MAALWMGMSGIASAHSFTAALLVVGEDLEVGLAEAVRGFLLAADERDGHANETSDGHLGGVDVHVLPLPREAAGLVEDLLGTPSEPPDVVVVLGPEPAASATARAYQSEGIVLVQDVLPAGWEGESQMDSFAARYRLVHGTAPSAMAATAYHAARCLDAAIRPLDGVNLQAALEEVWRSTELGLP
ncbi:hypothetical protein HYN69_20135 (plasmid) [Gemmobacter aquarius]|uniref:Uncharacterized protein n=1 Tax=Paragemmobacter aquarius TaxID=2169400 RepID=A0A2S0USX0_9RHOB|nr:hypothetical protein [Gemmobacter aquarius]AWB50743.1 hypothetical protein HYN69_19340 [Gemmobacter aquarius]AWB50882.1 hypothetical protein HYN69_20135 [Gemmobacter aquarius]